MLLKYCKCFMRNLRNYFSKSSIHGLCGICRSEGILERTFWGVIFLLTMYYLCQLLHSTIIEFTNQIVIKSIDTLAYPITEVPFPAVTVCNFNVAFKTKVAFFLKLLIDNGVEEKVAKSFFKELNNLRTPSYVEPGKYKQVYEVLKNNGYKSNKKFMREVAQPCDRLLKHCFWAGTTVNCKSIFADSKADIGLCCSFNSRLFPVNDTNQDEYFTTAGERAGLILKLDLAVEEYVSSAYNATSALVFVHERNAYPDSSAFFALLEQNKAISISINPSLYVADDDVRKVSLRSRRCLFDGEGFKIYGQNYSFANCMQLCKSKALANFCGCIPDNYPDTNLWRSCTLDDVNCLQKNMENYTALRMRLNVIENDSNKIVCDCLPSCSGIEYSGRLEYLDFHRHDQMEGNLSWVRIYFQNNWCFKYSSSRSMRSEAFLAAVGGFFALCVGGSLVSGVEIPYYFLKSFYVPRSSLKKKEYKPQIFWSELGTKTNKVAPKRRILYNTYLTEFVN